jgi:putative methionine-R-sulfoxide reductase with GAF domain
MKNSLLLPILSSLFYWPAPGSLPALSPLKKSDANSLIGQTIKFGKGACGAAAEKMDTQLVPNVEEFPGHIACDGDSKSEIVVPILVEGKVVAIIDIDCAQLQGFDETDRKELEELAGLLARACDW